MKESISVKLQEAETLANRVRDLFFDMYPKRKEDVPDYGEILGVFVMVIREDGIERYNSEFMEMKRYVAGLIQSLELAELYINIARMKGGERMGDMKSPIDVKGLTEYLERDK